MNGFEGRIWKAGAEDGCIVFWAEEDEFTYRAIKSSSPAELAEAVRKHSGFSEAFETSKSCQWATEYGFATQADFDEMYEQVFDHLCTFGM